MPMSNRFLLDEIASDLAAGHLTSRGLIDECLDRAASEGGQGSRVFIHLDPSKAIAQAEAIDCMRAAGVRLSRYAGIPISVKDLFDIDGEITRAGSTVLDDSAPAKADAVVVARLRRAGFVILGRTNMSEFAYSGLGLNPHYGTPLNCWDRVNARLPGGSSSGAVVSVTDGLAHGAIGTDTGGSCRIPAAFNGTVGFKPTATRIPLQGVVPLAPSLDSVGPIARSVRCCALLDAVLSGHDHVSLVPCAMDSMSFALPRNVVLDDLEPAVATVFSDSLRRLSAAGARIREVHVPEFERLADFQVKGGITAAESYAWHRDLIEGGRDEYDPVIASRILRGADQSASDYLDLLRLRKEFISAIDVRFADYDAVLMPTVAVVAPRIKDVSDEASFARFNALALRNTSIVNLFDGCAISIPIHNDGDAPVGLMIAGCNSHDITVLRCALACEAIFHPELGVVVSTH
jgi:aspartyl-tRNA(Asn)/glutamyl-tRNA(Gln) amidotransferase subunit A